MVTLARVKFGELVTPYTTGVKLDHRHYPVSLTFAAESPEFALIRELAKGYKLAVARKDCIEMSKVFASLGREEAILREKCDRPFFFIEGERYACWYEKKDSVVEIPKGDGVKKGTILVEPSGITYASDLIGKKIQIAGPLLLRVNVKSDPNPTKESDSFLITVLREESGVGIQELYQSQAIAQGKIGGSEVASNGVILNLTKTRYIKGRKKELIPYETR